MANAPEVSTILPAHRRRPYTLMDVISVEYHGKDDQRWLAGVNDFLFRATEFIGVLDACDPGPSGDIVATTAGSDRARRPFASFIKVDCSTLSGRGTLDQMVNWIGREHDAWLPEHLERELVNGTLSGLTAQSLDSLATAGGSAAAADLIGVAEKESSDTMHGVEVIILVPLAEFAEVTRNAGVRWDDGVLRTLAGNIVVPFSSPSNQATAYVVTTAIKVHLGPKNQMIPKNWVDIPTNTEFATSEILGLFEYDPATVKITIT